MNFFFPAALAKADERRIFLVSLSLLISLKDQQEEERASEGVGERGGENRKEEIEVVEKIRDAGCGFSACECMSVPVFPFARSPVSQ